jgi:glucose/arabinose dehydrogenase
MRTARGEALTQRLRSRHRIASSPAHPARGMLVAVALLLAGCAGGADEDASGRSAPEPAPPTLAPPTGDGADRATPPPDAPGAGRDAPGLPSVDVVLPALALEEVARIDAPTDTTLLADGTVLVAERGGVVRVLIGEQPGEVVVDVSDRTTTDGERGLLSVALAPWGDELVLSLTDPSGDTLVEAHPLAGTVVTGAPRILYRLAQPFANHNGGPVLFLPDGTLLIALGDGDGGGDPLGAGQDLSTPLGAILRLDVRDGRTTVPADNPFVTRAGSAPEILAYGLRNPWRVTLDADRGELWIADVGQSAREEINRVGVDELAGANFGWALREGSLPYLGDEPADHVAPLHDYAHDPGCSVTGGLVYRGSAIPALVGGYVFTDLCDGELRVLVQDGASVRSRALGVSGTRIVGFGTDGDGELLVLELGGRVLRLVAP